MMKTIPLLIALFLLCLIPPALSQEEYLTAGVDRQNTYDQGGTGNWPQTPTTYTRAGSIDSYFPVVGDIDNDGTQEIIYINNDLLTITNFTDDVGLVTEQTVAHGDTKIGTSQYYPTPYLIDDDDDNTPEVVSWNGSHMLVFRYNGSEVVLNKSAALNIDITANPTISNKYPVIKCAKGNQMASGNDTCVMVVNNRTGGVSEQFFVAYDIDAGTTSNTSVIIPNGNADTQFHNTHAFDGDSDGSLEFYQSEVDAANGDLRVYEIEVSATGIISVTLIKLHAIANNRPFTDIIVNRLDGATPMITWGYSSDATNYDAYTILASDGSLVSNSYCTVLTCPEGDMMSANLFVDDGTYGSYSGDVCYYLRNYDNNDPGVNIDTVHCLSQYAGSDHAETEVSNTVNFTNRPIIHTASMTGTGGLLTPKFILQGGTKQSNPILAGTDVCIPVDAQNDGGLDIICSNATVLTYYDDNVSNTNTQILQYTRTSGNPICNNTKVIYQVSVSDDESDAATCNIEVSYINGTSVYNSSNVSVTTPGTATFDYTFNSPSGTDAYTVTMNCKDQYHDTYTSITDSVWTSLPPGCYGFNENPFTNESITEDSETDQDIDDNFDSTVGILLGTSSKLRTIAGLAIVIGIMMAAGIRFRNGIVGAIAGIIALIMVTFIGLLSPYILIVTLIGMVLIIILAKMVFGSGGGGDGG